MKNVDWKEIGPGCSGRHCGGMLIAVGVYNFALNANFPVAGSRESPLSCITCWGFR